MPEPAVLHAAIGDYPHTRALMDGRVLSDRLRLEFADIAPINRAFAPMVRDLRFDVSEMAIATYFQARAAGVPLVLLPVALAARFQEGALFCRADSRLAGPADLAGRRVGVRAYAQTTGMWLRGILMDSFALPPDRIDWVVFEGAHVPGVTDPPWTRRAPPGADLLAMLRAGEVDAVIVGNDPPDDPDLRPVFPDPAAAAAAFQARHGFMPVNHMLTVTRDLAAGRPDLVTELLRMFASARPRGAPLPMGRAALQPAMDLALRYTAAQGLLARPLSADDIWEGTPPGGGALH